MILSKSHRGASQTVDQLCFQLTHNVALNTDFGRFRPLHETEGLWRPGAGEVNVAGKDRSIKEPSILARGSGEQIRGQGVDVLIADDVVTLANSDTVQQRDDLERWWRQEVENRLEPKSQAIVIGTKFAPDDLYSRLTAHQDPDFDEPRSIWLHVRLPALRDPDTGEPSVGVDAAPLWPERWPKKVLLRALASVGEAAFDTAYQQKDVATSEALARPEWIYGNEEYKGCLDRDRGSWPTPCPPDRVRVIGFDPSGSRGFAGLVVADVKTADKTFFDATILDVVQKRLPGNRDSMLELARLVAKFRPVRFLAIEKNIAERLLLDAEFKSWANSEGIKVLDYFTGSQKNDPMVGPSTLAADFEYGRISLAFGDSESQRASQLLIDEATTYPHGRTTDVVMALWLIRVQRHRLPRPRDPNQRSTGWDVPAHLRGNSWGQPGAPASW